MKKVTIGITAHVDAGKTTLAEAILYRSGKLRKAGRVDCGNTLLDSHELEKKRGITIFSGECSFVVGDKEINLIDTPGHIDFSAETERILPILDYSILVISGACGVQPHTKTLWKLLGWGRCCIPSVSREQCWHFYFQTGTFIRSFISLHWKVFCFIWELYC